MESAWKYPVFVTLDLQDYSASQVRHQAEVLLDRLTF